MKKYLFLIAVTFLAISNVHAYEAEFIDAHQWMVDNEMTRFTDIDAFAPMSWVTREQSAKFFVGFDRVVMGRDVETEMYCVYSDEASFDPTLSSAIQSACNRSLMRGADGVFNATAPLTKAQALTILIRSLDGVQEETMNPRWESYFVKAQERLLTKEKDVRSLDRPITRYELALLMWRVQHPLPDATSQMDELLEILSEFGLQEM